MLYPHIFKSGEVDRRICKLRKLEINQSMNKNFHSASNSVWYIVIRLRSHRRERTRNPTVTVTVVGRGA